MARRGKWIEGTAPEQPLSEAARRALEVRLGMVAHYLPLAAQRGGDEVEHVHQLRVATRRAAATLAIFRDTLPRHRAAWMKKKLKHVRRAAGAARDDDVMAARLETWSNRHPAVAMVLEEVRRRRRAAQAPIRKIHRKLNDQRFSRRIKELAARVRWRSDSGENEPCFGGAARQQLRPVVADFFEASTGDFSNIAALHEFRIAGKRLRYAMELFAAAFPPSFRQERYAEVEQVQTLLGDVNDHATALARLAAWQARTEPGELLVALNKLASAESTALRRSRQKFLAWWTDERSQRLRGEFEGQLSTSHQGC